MERIFELKKMAQEKLEQSQISKLAMKSQLLISFSECSFSFIRTNRIHFLLLKYGFETLCKKCLKVWLDVEALGVCGVEICPSKVNINNIFTTLFIFLFTVHDLKTSQ